MPRSTRSMTTHAAMAAAFAAASLATTATAGTFIPGYEDDAARYAQSGVFDPAARVLTNLGSGTGVLIGNRWLLTAAHVIGGAEQVNVQHNGRFYSSSRWFIHRDYSSTWIQDNTGGDIALILLDEKIKSNVSFPRVRGSRRVQGQEYAYAGYGLWGDGSTGAINESRGVRRGGNNIIDGHFDFNEDLGVFTGVQNSRAFFYSDFDGGYYDSGGERDSADDFPINLEWQGAPGDSGGAAYINGKVAGLASFVTSESDATQIAQFGSDTYFTNVGYYAKWIAAVRRKVRSQERFYSQDYGPNSPFVDAAGGVGGAGLPAGLDWILGAPVAVPEPTSALLALAGATVIGLRRRRRA